MPSESDPIDLQQIIAEVAARHNVFLKPGDPAFALVTINRLVLENSMEVMHREIRETIAKFDASIRKAEGRAGNILAQMVKESAVQMRCALQNDIHVAGVKAREIVRQLDQAHTRPVLIRWSAVGLASGAVLFGAGVWVGTLLH